MTVDKMYAALKTIILKMVLSDSIRERNDLISKAQQIIRELQNDHANAIKFSDDLSSRVLDIIKENKKLKRDIAFLEIAAGKTLFSQLQNTTYCMRQAVEYTEKENLYNKLKRSDAE